MTRQTLEEHNKILREKIEAEKSRNSRIDDNNKLQEELKKEQRKNSVWGSVLNWLEEKLHG